MHNSLKIIHERYPIAGKFTISRGSKTEALVIVCEIEIGVDEVCIIGGGNIYAQGLPLADVVHLTRVLATIDGDTYFPEIDSEVWHAISTENVPAGEKDSHPTRYIRYERRVA